MLRFNDGINIDTEGELRVTRLRDGYYVVGQGKCCPVDTYQEGIDWINKINSKKLTKGDNT